MGSPTCAKKKSLFPSNLMFVKGYRSAKRTAGKKKRKERKKEITKQAFKSRLFFERKKERKKRKEKGCLDARPRRALGGDPPRPPPTPAL